MHLSNVHSGRSIFDFQFLKVMRHFASDFEVIDYPIKLPFHALIFELLSRSFYEFLNWLRLHLNLLRQSYANSIRYHMSLAILDQVIFDAFRLTFDRVEKI